jgi:hypothetical protein
LGVSVHMVHSLVIGADSVVDASAGSACKGSVFDADVGNSHPWHHRLKRRMLCFVIIMLIILYALCSPNQTCATPAQFDKAAFSRIP